MSGDTAEVIELHKGDDEEELPKPVKLEPLTANELNELAQVMVGIHPAISVENARAMLGSTSVMLTRLGKCKTSALATGEPHDKPIVSTAVAASDQAEVAIKLVQVDNLKKIAAGGFQPGVVYLPQGNTNGYVTVAPDGDGGFVVKEFSTTSLEVLINSLLCFINPETGHVSPSAVVKKTALANLDGLKLPVLSGLSTMPKFALTNDGIHVASTLGYDPVSKAFITKDFGITRVAAPSSSDVDNALAVLEKGLGDFTYASDIDKGNAYALLLTAMLRETFPLAPGFGIVANNPQAGKTLLAKTITRMVSGASPVKIEAIDFSKSSAAFFSRTIQHHFTDHSSPTMIFDEPQESVRNKSEPLNIPYMNNLLTSEDGVHSRAAYMRSAEKQSTAGTTIIMMGNGLHFAAEMARRMVIINLEKKSDHTFPMQPKELTKMVLASHPDVVQAVVTLIDNWQAKGMPSPDWSKPTFEEWSHVVGGILAAAGVTDLDPGIEVPENDVTIHYAAFMKWIMNNVPGTWDNDVYATTSRQLRETIASPVLDTDAAIELEDIMEAAREQSSSKSANSWAKAKKLIKAGDTKKLELPLGVAVSASMSTEEKQDGAGGKVRSKLVASKGGRPPIIKITTDSHAVLDARGKHLH